jgi:hypothetical protein
MHKFRVTFSDIQKDGNGQTIELLEFVEAEVFDVFSGADCGVYKFFDADTCVAIVPFHLVRSVVRLENALLDRPAFQKTLSIGDCAEVERPEDTK